MTNSGYPILRHPIYSLYGVMSQLHPSPSKKQAHLDKAIINDDMELRYTKLKFPAKILSTMFVGQLSHLLNEFLQPRWESVLSRFD